MVMLVHSQEPAPDEGRDGRYWEPNWAVWTRAAVAVLLGYAALNSGGAVGTLLILLAFYAACRAIAEALPYMGGLTEWRQ